jgi:hypothetical protein
MQRQPWIRAASPWGGDLLSPRICLGVVLAGWDEESVLAATSVALAG